MWNHSTIFQQLLAFIPRYQFEKAVSLFQGDRYVKKFKCWAQFFCNIYAQISGKDSLRDIETGLRTQANKWYHLGLNNVARSTIAYANQNRDYHIFENLFYTLLNRCKDFTPKHRFKFKNPLYSLDASVIDLCLSLFPWAKFRKKKGAIKLHCMLDYRGEIPCFMVITDGKQHECKVVKTIDLPISSDSILCVDRGYIDFDWLKNLDSKGIFFVTRAKDNMKYSVIGQHPVKEKVGVIADEEIVLATGKYPKKLRLVTYEAQKTGKVYCFLTNNFVLAATTIAAIYKARWQIELFFKWIKQNLKIKTFLGTSKNAVLTQVWTAMIYYLLLAYIKYQSKYSHSILEFTRIIKETLFNRIPLFDLLSLKGSEVMKIKPNIIQLTFL